MTSYPEKDRDRPSVAQFGASIPPGLGLNLLCRDVDASARFQHEVLGAALVYWEEHFALLSLMGSTWMLHSDESYRRHAMLGTVVGVGLRGGGVEIRLYGVDPDLCCERAVAMGATVLSPPTVMVHGLKECYIVDPDGYVFVPSVPAL